MARNPFTKDKRNIRVGDFWLMGCETSDGNDKDYWQIQIIAHLKNHKKQNRWVAVKKPAAIIRKFDIYNIFDVLVFDDYGKIATPVEEYFMEFYLLWREERSKKKSALACDLLEVPECQVETK